MKWILNGFAIFLYTCLLNIGCSETDFEPCEIQQEECQKAVYQYLMQLRGDGWDVFNDMPPIKTISRDAYRNYLLSNSQAQDDGPNPWDRALQLLGLLAEETSTLQAYVDEKVDSVVAFYSWNTKDVTIIEYDPADFSTKFTAQQLKVWSSTTLIHEYVHSIQDREFGLRFDVQTIDRMFARDALIEGEATLYENLAYENMMIAEMRDRELSLRDWKSLYDEMTTSVKEEIADSNSPIFAVQTLLYPLGGAYLTHLWFRGGNAAIRHFYSDHPNSSIYYMSGFGSDQPHRLPPLLCEAEPPQGHSLFGYDSFGASIVYAFLIGADVEDPVAWNLAMGWEADNIWAFENENEETISLVWRIRFQTEKQASRFVDQVTAREERHMLLDKKDVQIVASDSPQILLDWESPSRCQ